MAAHPVRQHADALVREYLAKRGLKDTLAALDEESPRDEHALSSRTAIARGLKLERLVKRSRDRQPPLTMLEVVVEVLLANERPLRFETAPSMAAAVEKAVAGQGSGRGTAVVTSGSAACSPTAIGSGSGVADDWQAVPRPPAAPVGPTVRSGWGSSGCGGAASSAASGHADGAPSGDLSLVDEEEFDDDGGSAAAGSPALDRDYVRVRPVHGGSEVPVPSRVDRGAGVVAGAGGLNIPGLETSELGAATAAELSDIFHGKAGAEWMASWAHQGFGFCDVAALPYGLHQHRGGTCGVIAAVQALVIRDLLPDQDPSSCTPRQRDEALVRALAGSLWRVAEVAAAAETRALGTAGPRAPRVRLVCFPDNMSLPNPQEMGRVARVLETSSQSALHTALRQNLAGFQCQQGAGVVAFAYSCVLTAGGADAVRGHMDATGVGSSTLLGAHGYCTQELVNLVVTGTACSNVFDGTKELDGMVMRGVCARAPVGLISLFEHYGVLTVGDNLKCPEAPVWLCCMESHYTVLFCTETPPSSGFGDRFDLHYYDMLANQDYVIRLTLDLSAPSKVHRDGDLVPPLEDTLHTKWPNAHVDWNGVDPLL